jgi:hypothetical protein
MPRLLRESAERGSRNLDAGRERRSRCKGDTSGTRTTQVYVRVKHMLFLRKHIRDFSWSSSLLALLLVTKLPPQARAFPFGSGFASTDREGAQVRG